MLLLLAAYGLHAGGIVLSTFSSQRPACTPVDIRRFGLARPIVPIWLQAAVPAIVTSNKKKKENQVRMNTLLSQNGDRHM